MKGVGRGMQPVIEDEIGQQNCAGLCFMLGLLFDTEDRGDMCL
jgi:hypothetical protein